MSFHKGPLFDVIADTVYYLVFWLNFITVGHFEQFFKEYYEVLDDINTRTCSYNHYTGVKMQNDAMTPKENRFVDTVFLAYLCAVTGCGLFITFESIQANQYNFDDDESDIDLSEQRHAFPSRFAHVAFRSRVK